MSLKPVVEKLLRLYENVKTPRKKSILLKFLGSATVQVNVANTGECFQVIIGENITVEDCSMRKKDVILTGDLETLKSILNSGSGAKYMELEKEGRVKLKSCNFKGRVFISYFKKLINIM